MTLDMQVRKIILFSIAALLLATGCGADPNAADFAAPKLGTLQIEAEAFQVRFSCPVSGNLSGVSGYGIRFGTGSMKEIPARLEAGILKAEAKALHAETDYCVEAFLTNGAETISTGVTSFRTEQGPPTVDIPDAVFQRYILAHFDDNGDGVLTEPEAMRIKEITVCTDSIYSLQGIEKMGNLLSLEARGSDGYKGQLSTIDLSCNTALYYLNLNDNQIRNIDLSALLNLRTFQFASNYVSRLDFSNNRQINELYLNNLPLEELPDMSFLPLTSLHIDHSARLIPKDYMRNFPMLTGLNMGLYEGRTIDLSENTQLDALWAYECPYLEELDLTATSRLVILYIGECPRLRRVYVRAGTTFEQLEKDDQTEIVYVEQD